MLTLRRRDTPNLTEFWDTVVGESRRRINGYSAVRRRAEYHYSTRLTTDPMLFALSV